jgi:hypothetical protein
LRVRSSPPRLPARPPLTDDRPHHTSTTTRSTSLLRHPHVRTEVRRKKDPLHTRARRDTPTQHPRARIPPTKNTHNQQAPRPFESPTLMTMATCSKGLEHRRFPCRTACPSPPVTPRTAGWREPKALARRPTFAEGAPARMCVRVSGSPHVPVAENPPQLQRTCDPARRFVAGDGEPPRYSRWRRSQTSPPLKAIRPLHPPTPCCAAGETPRPPGPTTPTPPCGHMRAAKLALGERRSANGPSTPPRNQLQQERVLTSASALCSHPAVIAPLFDLLLTAR